LTLAAALVVSWEEPEELVAVPEEEEASLSLLSLLSLSPEAKG
jgi:hypothetical protein